MYFALSDNLNESIRHDAPKMAALSVISQYIFMKRNSVSIKKPSSLYYQKQMRRLPINAPKFFPEVKSFLEAIRAICSPDKFDNAVLSKIDIFTQTLYSMRDKKYFELKNFFFTIEHCATPLDLLFRGLFYARARQNIRKIIWAVVAIIILIIFLIIILSL